MQELFSWIFEGFYQQSTSCPVSVTSTMISHCADGRMEVLCASAIRAGGSLECAREILEAGTTDEALAVLDSYGILKETMAVVMEKIQFYLDHRSYEQILLGAVVFSNVYGLLGQTRDAEELIHKIQEQAVGVNDIS